MKSFVLWNTTPCSPFKVSRRFGGTCRSLLQGRRINQARNQCESKWKAESELIIRPWRWRPHIPSKRRLIFDGLQGVISQKIELFVPPLEEPQILNCNMHCVSIRHCVSTCPEYVRSELVNKRNVLEILKCHYKISLFLHIKKAKFCIEVGQLNIVILYSHNSFIKGAFFWFFPHTPTHKFLTIKTTRRILWTRHSMLFKYVSINNNADWITNRWIVGIVFDASLLNGFRLQVFSLVRCMLCRRSVFLCSCSLKNDISDFRFLW
jgi:hypothetical protein